MNIKSESSANVVKYSMRDLEVCRYTKEPVVGIVTKYIPNEGVEVDLGGIMGKISISDFEDSPNVVTAALVSKVGKKICAFIEGIENDFVVLNRRKCQWLHKEFCLSHMEVGTIFDTNIVSVAPFGVFVDMGYGVLGLLPIGDVSVARFTNIREIFSIGDSLKVVYKGQVDGKYVVTHKELLGTWDENVKDFSDGSVIQGVIREIKSYGAFIEIAPNFTGLADFPENFDVHVGDSVSVLLKSTNAEKLKVKLHIVGISEMPYKVKYNYRITEGEISRWVYTPDTSFKKIETVFKE